MVRLGPVPTHCAWGWAGMTPCKLYRMVLVPHIAESVGWSKVIQPPHGSVRNSTAPQVLTAFVTQCTQPTRHKKVGIEGKRFQTLTWSMS